MEDRKKIEAVLFAVGDKIEEAELARLTRLPLETVKAELHQLKEDYSQANSTFIVLNEGTKWKLTVGEDYMSLVQKIVPKTELSRPVLETLAVIAWKSPVLQSSIISIRSNKGYDHIAELEQVGFITKQKYGRSFMLRLSQQFFEYFDIKDKAQIKDVFSGIKGTEAPIAQEDQADSEVTGEEGAEVGGDDEDVSNIKKQAMNLPVETKTGVPAVKESDENKLPMATQNDSNPIQEQSGAKQKVHKKKEKTL